MDIEDNEIINLWRLFYEINLEYIMVGGFASNFHGFQRTTADIDIWIKDSVSNRQKLRKVINELGIGDFKSIETTQFVSGFTSILLNSGIELDIMTSLKGFDQERFDECYAMSSIATIQGVAVRFMNINQLIEAKTASGRPKDLIDIDELTKIKKLYSGNK